MFFKRIECVGFKSFASKTSIDLIPGITVIVGPNGCGKSNILDAIKWVLGDQSARSLRGKKMQDIIFAGSGSYKPMGMAQVTLTLDNSNRTLDTDYDEVQISRRLYRSGESEYLINKSICRRKDILDLFLGTGIGTSAYSILEQGKVDQIINAKPQERRFIFEEAAGVSKYRVRKLEAVRRLERVAHDLKRLDDLLIEIERQVGSLKRQANKAERYKMASVELARLEKELMVLRSSGLRNELGSIAKDLETLQDKTQALSTTYAREAALEQEGRQLADSVDVRLTERGAELYRIKSSVTEVEHQIQRFKDQIETNRNRLEQIENEFAEMQRRAEELGARATDLGERKAAAAVELTGAEEKYLEKQSNYTDLEREVRAESEALEALAGEIGTRRTDLSRCENEIRIAETLIARHRETLAEVEAELERNENEATAQDARRTEMETALGELAEKLTGTEQGVRQLEQTRDEAHERAVDLKNKLDSTRRDLHQRQARLATLTELRASFEGFLRGVREVMENAEEAGLRGVKGPLASQIKTKSRFERAIEAALGVHLEDILVEDLDSAKAALDYLISRDSGRATFQPLADSDDELARNADEANATDAALLARKGVIARASEVVDAVGKAAKTIQALLSRTFITRDLDTALALRGEFPGVNFVSLDGQVAHSGGALSGGRADSSGLLGREREIGELETSVAELDRNDKALAADLESCEAEAGELVARLGERTEELQTLRVEMANAQKDFEAARSAHEQALGRARQRQGQRDQIEGEIGERKSEIAEKTEQARIHEGELERVGAELSSRREQAKSRSDEFIRRGTEMAEARAEIEKVSERLVHLNESLESLATERATLERSREARSGEMERIIAANAEAQAGIRKAQETLVDLLAKRDQLDRALTEDEEQRDRIRMDLKAKAAELDKIQRDERIVENELHEKELRRTEYRTTLQSLSEQAEEKFETSLEQIAQRIGEVDKDPMALSNETSDLRRKIERMGPVNMAALEEYEDQAVRLEFLTEQRADLIESKTKIEETIAKIDETTKALFHETFESVRGHFIEMFRRLFNGGKADLVIEQEGDDPLLDGGIEIYAQPPGKKLQALSLMSGGEKAMTAISLLFALFLHKPAPFAILDEIDAPLDDVNVERFKKVVAEFARDTQFIIISHNKQTMQLADAIYGVTMEESGVSKVISVRFEQAEEYLTPVG